MPVAADRPGVVFLFAVVLGAVGVRPDQGSAAAPYQCGTRLVELLATELPLPDPPLGAAKPAGTADAWQDLPEIGVGTRQEFPVAGNPRLVQATCRYAGERVFVFVEDRQWDTNGGSILQSHVDGVADLFERATPADPGRGIHDLCTEAFGAVPDVDGYPQVFLLILDIPDSRLVGFFDARVAGHEVPEMRRDILYVDEWFLRRQPYLARGTLAHEFQHLIHWGHDTDEEIWLNEGMSGYAEALIGFPEADSTVVGAFLRRPGAGLTAWENRAWNYGSTYLFSAFLAERYGGDLIRAVVAEQENGIHGVDAAFAGLGLRGDFEEAWSGWVLGNYAGEGDEITYGALRGRRALWYPIDRLPLESRMGSVEDRWGTTAILLRTPGSVQVEFAGKEEGRYRVWTRSMRAGGRELRELELDASNRGSAIAAEIDSMALIVGRTSVVNGEFEISARHLQPVAARRTGVEATVLGDAVEGLTVEFSRAIAGRPRDYAWSAVTDAAGRVALTISGTDRVTGFYQARALTSEDKVVGQWHSIPLNRDRRQILELTLGGGMRVVAVEPLDARGRQGQAVAAATPVFRLGRGFPNPFNAEVRVPFSGETEGLEISVYNALGQRIRDLAPPSGSREIAWDGLDGGGRRAGSGVYWIVARTKAAVDRGGYRSGHRTPVTLVR